MSDDTTPDDDLVHTRTVRALNIMTISGVPLGGAVVVAGQELGVLPMYQPWIFCGVSLVLWLIIGWIGWQINPDARTIAVTYEEREMYD